MIITEECRFSYSVSKQNTRSARKQSGYLHKSVIIRYEKTIRLFLRFPGGINGSTKDKEPLIQKFCGEIQYHIDGRYQVFVPQQAGCQEIAQ